jgi:hypothetical protein
MKPLFKKGDKVTIKNLHVYGADGEGIVLGYAKDGKVRVETGGMIMYIEESRLQLCET